jgi:hypothetical protein
VDYEEDAQLAELVERLRVTLERGASPDAALADEVDAALRLLMARNQRRRVLQRMHAHGWLDGRPEQARADLEALDGQLRVLLPPLLARLELRDAPQGP